MSTTQETLAQQIERIGAQAREAALALALLTTEQKNAILHAMADELLAQEKAILSANALDIAAAEKNGLSSAMVDRLRLDEKRLQAMAQGIRQVAALRDPVGEILESWERPNGLRLEKKRVPIGVIGMIYESRPNVTSDAASLCFKSGNATILRGGRESFHSNTAIAQALQTAVQKLGAPIHAVQLIPTTDREAVTLLCQLDRYLDLIIPRGGKGLIETVVAQARMPVIKHYDGICHLYIDEKADLAMAARVALNAKAQKPSVCNALETLLVHRTVATRFFQEHGGDFLEKKIELRAETELLSQFPQIFAREATEEDWRTEYLELILSVKVVDDLDEAITHINHYGSKHSDVIITTDEAAAEKFMASVDSACVLWNASTRFNDGEEFGFGAEIGISTDKLHARGPMALPELTSYKYLVRGTGQIRG
jgi:glutamate-5-semialdehyde dehydrogenase